MTQAIEEIREALHVEPANRDMKAKLREWKLETQSDAEGIDDVTRGPPLASQPL